MGGLAASGELMVLTMEEAHPGRNAFVDQGLHELIPFFDGAAIVLVAMDEQSRGNGFGNVFDR